jgi:hypothetical protein
MSRSRSLSRGLPGSRWSTISCWRSATFSSARSRRLFSAETTLHPTICTQSHIDACSHWTVKRPVISQKMGFSPPTPSPPWCQRERRTGRWGCRRTPKVQATPPPQRRTRAGGASTAETFSPANPRCCGVRPPRGPWTEAQEVRGRLPGAWLPSSLRIRFAGCRGDGGWATTPGPPSSPGTSGTPAPCWGRRGPSKRR